MWYALADERGRALYAAKEFGYTFAAFAAMVMLMVDVSGLLLEDKYTDDVAEELCRIGVKAQGDGLKEVATQMICLQDHMEKRKNPEQSYIRDICRLIHVCSELNEAAKYQDHKTAYYTYLKFNVDARYHALIASPL